MARAMKDSGIEWIGKIPDNWISVKIKYISNFINGFAFDSGDLLSEGDFPVIRIGDISNGNIDFQSASKTNKEKGLEAYLIKNDDLLIAMSGATVGKTGLVSNINTKAYINQRVGIIRSSYNHYLKYCLMTPQFFEYIQLLSSGTAQPNISTVGIGNYPIIISSSEEIRSITAFLDEKCASIDAVIEKTKASIEEYKKLKQSVITQAVTKGIRPNRKMKDSGIDWIGEVPEEWEVYRFGRVITVKSNLVNPEEYQDYPQIAPDNIKKGEACLVDNVKTVKEVGVISWNHLFYKGQIIYSKIRPMLNKVIIAPFDGLCSADMYPIETSQNVDYVVYMMLSDCFLSQVGLVTMNRVKMPKINQNELSNIIMPIPGLEEQKEITDYLKNKCKRIDLLIEKKEKEFTEMEQFKKCLIYEYVTGKKEVPDCY